MQLAIIGVVFLFAHGACQQSCPPGQEYSDCGSRCPPTCTNPEPICITLCVKGCFCKKGTIGDGSGKCIDPKHCPSTSSVTTRRPTTPRCGRHEEYVSCPNPCPNTCDNPRNALQCKRKCDDFGCQCKKDYLRDRSNRCVLPRQCNSSRCGQHEQWSNAECVPPPGCQARCPDLPQIACKLDCRQLHGGCVCRPGFLRNRSGKCIPEHQCGSSKQQSNTN